MDNHYSKRPTWLRRRATCEPVWPCSMRGLPCRARYLARGALLPHLFTLTLAGGLFSAALSVRRKKEKTPARPFERRTALWSPEVPPPALKLAGSGYLATAYIIAKKMFCFLQPDYFLRMFSEGLKRTFCFSGT